MSKTIEVYTYDELDDEAKEKAYYWYLSVASYDDIQFAIQDIKSDLANVGINLVEYDIEQGHIKLQTLPKYTWEEVAYRITREHGEECETYKIAHAYSETVKTHGKIISALADIEDYISASVADPETLSDMLDGIETLVDAQYDEHLDTFIEELSEEYLSMIRREIEYLESEKYIEDMILANEYTFTKEGQRVN